MQRWRPAQAAGLTTWLPHQSADPTAPPPPPRSSPTTLTSAAACASAGLGRTSSTSSPGCAGGAAATLTALFNSSCPARVRSRGRAVPPTPPLLLSPTRCQHVATLCFLTGVSRPRPRLLPRCPGRRPPARGGLPGTPGMPAAPTCCRQLLLLPRCRCAGGHLAASPCACAQVTAETPLRDGQKMRHFIHRHEPPVPAGPIQVCGSVPGGMQVSRVAPAQWDACRPACSPRMPANRGCPLTLLPCPALCARLPSGGGPERRHGGGVQARGHAGTRGGAVPQEHGAGGTAGGAAGAGHAPPGAQVGGGPIEWPRTL